MTSTTTESPLTWDDAVAEIEALPGVRGANLWTRVPGKERIYVKTVKSNGGKRWNYGVGYNQCYVDLQAGHVEFSGEAGAATRKQHARLGTHEALKAIAARLVQ